MCATNGISSPCCESMKKVACNGNIKKLIKNFQNEKVCFSLWDHIAACKTCYETNKNGLKRIEAKAKAKTIYFLEYL